MRDVNLYICRLYLDKMKRFFSFFILSLFLSAVNLFAQTEPIAHLVVDQSSIEEDGGSTKLRVNLKDASENAMNATVVTNIVITCVDFSTRPSLSPVISLNCLALIINFCPSKNFLSSGPIIILTID